MTERATASFKIESWDERRIDGTDSLAQASVRQSLSGDIEGEGAVEWLMAYRPDRTADFVGLQQIAGRLGGRSGSFSLLQTDGTFDGEVASGKLAVVPGSASGELEGLRGGGEFRAPHGGEATISLEYDFE